MGLTPDHITDLEKKRQRKPTKRRPIRAATRTYTCAPSSTFFLGGDYHAKQIIAVEVEFTAIGNLTLEINKILADRVGGWLRLYGDLHLKHDKDFYYVDLQSQESFM